MTAALAYVRQSREAVSFTPRLDLRSGLTAAMRAGARNPDQDVAAFAETAADAVRLWRACRPAAPLALCPPHAALADPAVLDDMMRAAGAEPTRTILELDEVWLAENAASLDGVRRLKARRWCLALRMDAAAGLPLDHHDRALFGEFLIDVSAGLPAYAGLFLVDRTPLSLRLQAAKAAGAAITALGIDDHLGRRRAFQIGFDRGETNAARTAVRSI